MIHEYSVTITYSIAKGTLLVTHSVKSGSYVGALQAALREPLTEKHEDLIKDVTEIKIVRGELLKV